MAIIHTLASGTEPFDKTYCVGYQVHHEDWSPYPRVNRLRQTFLDRPYEIDLERLRLVTQAYQEHENEPRKLQCAYAFEKFLRLQIHRKRATERNPAHRQSQWLGLYSIQSAVRQTIQQQHPVLLSPEFPL